MANRVVINICGEELTFIAEESSSYMQRVGAYVNDKMAEVLDSSKAVSYTHLTLPTSGLV